MSEPFVPDLASEIINALDDVQRVTVDYAADPVRWADERGRMHIWSRQREVLESVRDHRRTVVRACHSSGKSYIAATAACWWIDSHPPGEAFILTSAPTAPQVRAILWRNINRIHSSAGLPGRCNQTEWFVPNADGSEELVGIGRKPSEHSEGAFQGIHARYILVILDESQGVPRALWDATESIASNQNARILAIGNPDVMTGPFVDACNTPQLWNEIHIGYKHTPAATGEQVPPEVADGLISRLWAEDRRTAWGEDSALYQSKVLGELPTGDADPWRVIPESEAAACRYLEPAYDDDPVRVGGIDVGGGEDRTVIIERINFGVGRVRSFQERDPIKAADQLVALIQDWNLTRVNIDVIGVGWGLAGILRKALPDVAVQGINFAAKSNYPKKFYNLRAECWWHGRDLARDRAWSLTALDDDAIAELTMPRYEIRNGKILIEPKDDVRERLGRSPDIADALLLAFFDGLWIPPVTDARSAFAGASLLNGSGSGGSMFGGSAIPGLPMSIPTNLMQR